MADSFKVRFDEVLEKKLDELSQYTGESTHHIGETAIEYFIEKQPNIFDSAMSDKLEDIKNKISEFEFDMIKHLIKENILKYELFISLKNNHILIGKGANIKFLIPNIIIFRPTIFTEISIPMHKVSKVVVNNEEMKEVQGWNSSLNINNIMWYVD